MLNIYHFLHFQFLAFLRYKMYNVIHLNCFSFLRLAFSLCIIFLIRNVEMFNHLAFIVVIRAKDFLLLAVLARRARGNARGFAALFNSRLPSLG
jgi:hypothetical protein